MVEGEKRERELSQRWIHFIYHVGNLTVALSEQLPNRLADNAWLIGQLDFIQPGWALHCVCLRKGDLRVQVYHSLRTVLRVKARPAFEALYCQVRDIQLFQVPDQREAPFDCDFHVLAQLVLFADALTPDWGEDQSWSQHIYGLFALYCRYSSYSGIWKHLGEDFLRKDCVDFFHLDRSYVNFFTSHLFHAVDGAVLARRGGAFASVFIGKKVGDH